MEFIFELIADLFLEGSVEIASNKKISKWIRYPILAIIILFFIVIIFGLMYLGIISLKNSLIGGAFIILVGIILFIACIYKFKEVYLREKESIISKEEKNEN